MTIRDISTRFDCAFAAAAMPCAAVSAAEDAAGDRLPLVFDDGRDDNDAPSPRRAAVVRRSLADHDPWTQRRHDIAGFGERLPVAPNAHADGSDGPQARQRNRLVEVVLRALP